MASMLRGIYRRRWSSMVSVQHQAAKIENEIEGFRGVVMEGGLVRSLHGV